MDKVSAQTTVYFDGMFWVGLFERVENNKLTVARVVFGSEPSAPELYEFILKNGYNLEYSPAVEATIREAHKNPKRIQREARKLMQESGIGTKSQQALKKQQEQNKLERKANSRERKRAEEQRKFELKQQKKREKHKGH